MWPADTGPRCSFVPDIDQHPPATALNRPIARFHWLGFTHGLLATECHTSHRIVHPAPFSRLFGCPGAPATFVALVIQSAMSRGCGQKCSAAA
jgi:hypothetical protein